MSKRAPALKSCEALMESGNESLMPTFILLGDDYVAINFVSRRLRKAKKNFSRENKNKKKL